MMKAMVEQLEEERVAAIARIGNFMMEAVLAVMLFKIWVG